MLEKILNKTIKQNFQGNQKTISFFLFLCEIFWIAVFLKYDQLYFSKALTVFMQYACVSQLEYIIFIDNIENQVTMLKELSSVLHFSW